MMPDDVLSASMYYSALALNIAMSTGELTVTCSTRTI
jgi:hypothetical protein